MMTFTEIARDPKNAALLAALSPEAQRAASKLIEQLDRIPLDDAERVLDYILDGTPLPPLEPRKPLRDDDPICTLIDDGQRSGVRLERFDWPDGHSAWLDFHAGDPIPGFTSGRVMVSIDLFGGKPGLELTVYGSAISGRKVTEDNWSLADLRQLRDDIDLLLRDERLIGALAEQTIE